jgi:hypothetical protein
MGPWGAKFSASRLCQTNSAAARPCFLLKVGKKVRVRGISHLAKNERDMGHPTLCGREKVGGLDAGSDAGEGEEHGAAYRLSKDFCRVENAE